MMRRREFKVWEIKRKHSEMKGNPSYLPPPLFLFPGAGLGERARGNPQGGGCAIVVWMVPEVRQ